MADTSSPDSNYTATGLPADGQTADAADINTDLQGIIDRFNAHTHGFANSLATYVPTWTGAGSNPAIGNGTLTSRYVQYGKIVYFMMYLAFGSTTTPGSGAWAFTLPVASSSSNYSIINFAILDSGTTGYSGVFTLGASASSISSVLIGGNTGTILSSSSPMTWASGDKLWVSGFYEVA